MEKVNAFFRDNPPPNNTVKVKWEMVLPEPQPDQSQYQGSSRDTVLWEIFFFYNHKIFIIEKYTNHPKGYRNNPLCPVLRGIGHCPHCLCAPCVIAHPPDWLRGACSAHPANDGKRYRLYRMFWRLLKDLRLWNDDEYLARKESRTTKHDKREIIPKCVVAVSSGILYMYLYVLHVHLHVGYKIKIPK